MSEDDSKRESLESDELELDGLEVFQFRVGSG